MIQPITAARFQTVPLPAHLPYWWWMLPVLLLLFWLSVHNLDTNPVWGDERFSIRDAGGVFYGPIDLAGIWERVASGNPWHTPGFFMLLHAWGRFVGWELPALRVLPLLFGLLTAAWTYRLGSDFLSRRAGLYSAIILSTSIMFIHYLIKVRMYTQITLLTVCTLWFYLWLVDERRKPVWWGWLGFFIGAVGLLYTHYFAAIPLAVIGLYHLLFVPKNKHWLKISGVLALAGALFLPWVNVLLDGLVHARDYEDLHEIAVNSGEALYRIAFLLGNTHFWLLLFALSLAALLTWQQRRTARRSIFQLWFFTGAILVVILGINEVMKIMHEGRLRYLIGLWPLFALIIGYGAAELARRRRAAALVLIGLFAVTGAYSIASRAASRDLDGFEYFFPFHHIADALDGAVRAGDMVINFLPDGDEPQRDFHYTGITPFYFGSHLTQTWLRSEDPDKQEQTLDETGAQLSIWLAYPPEPPPSGLAAFTDALAADYHFCRKFHEASDFRIDWYTRLPLCCPGDAPPRIVYPEGIGLVGLELLPTTSDGILPVAASWAIEANSPYYSYSMALHVTDSVGTLVAQGDQGLELPARLCQQVNIPTADLPAGGYTLHLIVYNWETGARLHGSDRQSGAEGERLAVATFEVE